MLKVLLAYRCSDEGRENPFERVLPVGVGYINAYLREKGVPTVLANVSAMDESEVRAILAAERPDIVGVSCFTFNRAASIDLARIVKEALPQATVVFGGPHATHTGPSLMRAAPQVDACIAGEGELTLERFAATLGDRGDLRAIPGLVLRSGGDTLETGPAVPIADLDSLPFPALHPEGYGVDPLAQYPYIVSSRGCPAACSFCSSPEFWGKTTRWRSAENILDELALLKNRFGIHYVSFRDDIFTLNKRRVLALCRGMVERRLSLLWDCQTRVNTIDEERLVWLKRAGAILVQYGMESGSSRILDRLQKGQTIAQAERAADLTRKVGLVLSIYLITGVPGETMDDVEATETFIRRIRPHDGIVTPLAVFPGTDLWTEYSLDRAVDEDLWNGVARDGIYVRPERFTEEAMLRLSALLEEAAEENAYGAEDFARHRGISGPCHATDLMEGEHLERSGDPSGARRLYEDLAAREPWNPWPSFRLGRLSHAVGDLERAERFAAEALERAPRFADAAILLQDLEDARRPAATHGKAARRPAPRAFQSHPAPPPASERGSPRG